MSNSETMKRLHREGKLKIWNRGLTKETDSRLKKYGKTQSETKRRLHKKGKLVVWNRGLTKETDSRIKELGKRESVTKKRLFKEGKLKSWSTGLTKETSPSVAKISKKLSGRVFSEEHCKKLGEIKKSRPDWSKGLTKETDARVAKRTVNHWLQTEAGKAHHSERMKNGFSVEMLAGVRNPSKPQLRLFEFIKRFFPSAVLNYPFRAWNGKHYSLDIAVPELKVDFEYDEPFWHSDNCFQEWNAVRDVFRDEALVESGWAVVRVTGIEELKGLMS